MVLVLLVHGDQTPALCNDPGHLLSVCKFFPEYLAKGIMYRGIIVQIIHMLFRDETVDPFGIRMEIVKTGMILYKRINEDTTAESQG